MAQCWVIVGAARGECRPMLYFLPFHENRALRAPDPHAHMRSYLSVTVLVTSLLAGCSFDSIVGVVDPYRIDVRQGNYVDQDMVSQLKRGMSRDQVRFVLGSPLVVDMFRRDRWDYVYRFKPGAGEAEQRVISVFFVDDRLDHVDGDVQGGADASATRSERTRVVEVPAAVDD